MEAVHGGDVYRHPVAYDFSVNINPLGMPKESIRAAQEGVLLSAGQYPDCRGEALCTALAQKKEIAREQIVLGNGAAELIYALCQYLRPRRGMITAPAFQEYEEALKSVGAELTVWELSEEKNFAVDESLLDAIQREEDILFLCSPNNPNGSVIEKELLCRLAKRCEETETYLCVDECFLPFLGQKREQELSMMRELAQYPHLLVLRAFTKIYAMPGLRIGYACSASQSLLEGIKSVLQPWNTSVPAQMAALAALQDEEYSNRTQCLLQEERAYLVRELSAGLAEKIYPSEANFILFESRMDLKERLLEKGILIRSCENYRNLSKGMFRIAIRRHEENEELIRRWREIV